MWCFYLIIVFLLVDVGDAVDLTVTAKASGSDVVRAVVHLIRESCIFDDDKLLLRRIAYAETKDGAASFTFIRQGNEFYGGIWQISESNFNALKTRTSPETLSLIRNEFGIVWVNTSYSDLQKPLYSGLAARLLIDSYYKPIRKQIPQTIQEQAQYWANRYTINDWGGSAAAIETYTNASSVVQKVCASPKADIVFVLDGSGSIGLSNFNLIKQFVIAIVNSSDVSPQKVRFGLIEFSDTATQYFTLSQYNSTADVRSACNRVPYIGGGTNTAAGLRSLNKMIEAEGRHKKGIAVMSVVLTDGQSNNPIETNATASLFHQNFSEVTVFSVGVGSGAVFSELSAIASPPSCQNVFQLSGFSDVTSFTDQIMEQACEVSAVLPLGTNLTRGIVGFNEMYYFKIFVSLLNNRMSVKVMTLSGGIKTFFSWRVPNPNQALNDYSATVDDSMSGGKNLLIFGDNKRSRRSTDETEAILYVAVVGVQQKDNEFQMAFNKYNESEWLNNGGSSASSTTQIVKCFLISALLILAL